VSRAQEDIRFEAVGGGAVARAHDGRVKAEYALSTPRLNWSNNQINWYYSPVAEPAYLTSDSVVAMIQAATNRWSRMCNVTFNYMGLAAGLPYMGSFASVVDHKNIFGWSSAVVDSFYDYNIWFNTSSSLISDADIALNPNLDWRAESIDGIYTAALGHLLGLNSSNDINSILYTSSQTSVYRRTLRGDDAAGCAALFGAAPQADTERALNWAEASFSQLLSPSPAPSVYKDGVVTRTYSDSHSSVAVKNGVAYYTGPDGVVQNVGTVASYSSQVQAAGF